MMSHSLPSTSLNSSHKQSQEAEQSLGEAALLRIQTFDMCTKLDPDQLRKIKELDWENLDVGHLIGQGSFSSVHTVRVKEGQHFNDQVYALKSLKRRTTSNKDALAVGAVDLILEAKILSSLHHPNIIKLHAVKGGDFGESSTTAGGGYFLVLDLLMCTLESRLDVWRDQRSCIPFWRRVSSKDRASRIETVALGVAKGLAYLHSKNIVFRDLKPENVGFDEHGAVCIFDFGLAREYDPAFCSENTIAEGARHMTGNCGTPRYMAPEVAALQEYGFGCDVYSFSIMLWEICTLKRAFDDLSSSSAFNEEVVRGNKRPSLSIISSPALRDLLSQGWDKNACARPPFLMIVETLEAEIKVVSKKLRARARPSFSRSQSLQMPISAPPGNLRMLLNRARSAIELQSGEESRGSSSRERAGFHLGLDLTKRSRRFRLSIDPPPPVLDRSMGSTA